MEKASWSEIKQKSETERASGSLMVPQIRLASVIGYDFGYRLQRERQTERTSELERHTEREEDEGSFDALHHRSALVVVCKLLVRSKSKGEDESNCRQASKQASERASKQASERQSEIREIVHLHHTTLLEL